MFIDRLLNLGPAPVLERTLEFTDARQNILAEDVANVSTPNYQSKDLSFAGFQKMLRERVERRGAGDDASFNDISAAIQHPNGGILFHDGNNRSMEQLMSDNAQNALTHNMAVEMLRRQFQTLDMALREKLS